jgi:nondiscriminating glutamyl-tRNA synthetase
MSEQTKSVRVRIAPSPTGFMHVGTLRMALYNYVFARKHGGKFVLRIEDTDRTRFVEGALENIVETLHAFGLTPDEGLVWQDGKIVEQGDLGPYTQSQRLNIYKKYAEELIAKNVAYYCFCIPERLEELRKSQEAQKKAPKYDKYCLHLPPEEVQKRIAAGERHVIRLNVPADQTIRFTDLVRGEIAISTNDIDDQVLLKSDGFPTYHLAVVVDDHLMGITHIIRGEEWLPSTPKHILLYSAFGWESPQHVHLPLLLSPSKKKLSKRDGDVAVKDFLAQGYLPQALINFVALLGWNPKTEQELFTLDELIEQFDVAKTNKSGAIFDLEKLDWLNGAYIRQLSLSELRQYTKPYLEAAGFKLENYPTEFIEAVLKLEQERLKKLSEIGERVAYFFNEPEYDSEILVWKKSNREDTQKNLQAVYSKLQEIDANNFQQQFLETEIKNYLQQNNIGTGDALWPLRVALSGLSASPSPFEIMGAFGVLPNGKDVILSRVNKAIEKLS